MRSSGLFAPASCWSAPRCHSPLFAPGSQMQSIQAGRRPFLLLLTPPRRVIQSRQSQLSVSPPKNRPRAWSGFQAASSRWVATTLERCPTAAPMPCPMRGRSTGYPSTASGWIEVEVTNQQYAAFVKATGYVTVAERTPRAEDFPGAPPENLVAGSVVFSPPQQAVPLDNHYQWWSYVKGASWRHPEGPKSTIENRDDYPVTQIAYEDAEAYREVGRQAASDRKRMGVCGARGAFRKDVCLGR